MMAAAAAIPSLPTTTCTGRERMSTTGTSRLPEIIANREQELLNAWITALDSQSGDKRADKTIRGVAREFLNAIRLATQKGDVTDITGQHWSSMRSLLDHF